MVAGVILAILWSYVVWAAATGNFRSVVAKQVYRSAQPSGDTLSRYWRDHGIRTVINLRGENDSAAWYQDEIATSRRLGIRYIDFRMSAKRGISKKEASQLIEIMRRAPKPLMIHCESEAGRTGLASALYVAAVARLGERAAETQMSPSLWSQRRALRQGLGHDRHLRGYGAVARLHR